MKKNTKEDILSSKKIVLNSDDISFQITKVKGAPDQLIDEKLSNQSNFSEVYFEFQYKEFKKNILSFRRYLNILKTKCDFEDSKLNILFTEDEEKNEYRARYVDKLYVQSCNQIDKHFINIHRILFEDLKFDEFKNDPKFIKFINFYKKNIDSYLIQSSFSKHIRYKPFGFPGDYLTIQQIYENSPKSEFLFNRLLEKYTLNISLGYGVRSRVNFINEIICNMCKSLGSLNVLNIASGPGYELKDLISRNSELNISFTLVDSDLNSLSYIKNNLLSIPEKYFIDYIPLNIFEFFNKTSEIYDVIYSLGLFDYFNDKLFVKYVNKLLLRLRAGGVLVIGNMDSEPVSKTYMIIMGSWKLRYRSRNDLEILMKKTNANKFLIETDASLTQHFIKIFA